MRTTRREVIAVVAAAGAAAPLVGCGGSQQPDDPSEPVRVPLDQIPDDGGVITDGVVVTHVGDAGYKAFDARCPHQGCTVGEVTAEAIICPCHGSQFDPASGDMTQGPATEGLTELTATVEGDEVVVSQG